MITLKLNLTAFAHALMQSDKEKDEIILCVPVKKNKFFLSEKRNVYLDVVGFEFENKNPDSRDTHLLKQSFTKDELLKMTDEQKKALPIIGNACVNFGQRKESEPNDLAGGKVVDGINNLPF